MRKALLLVVTFILLIAEAGASEVRLNVPWLSQLDVKNGLGTDWGKSMNCGPTALVMSAAYLKDFFPTTIDVKRVDDWLVESGFIDDVNQYNLPEPGTGQSELRKAAGNLFGLSKTRFFSTKFWGLEKDVQLRMMAYSLQMNCPVIVGVKSRMEPDGQHHWMVLSGLRDTNGDNRIDEVHVNDPGTDTELSRGRKWYPVSQFRSVWWGSIFFMDVDAGSLADHRSLFSNDPPDKPNPSLRYTEEGRIGPRTRSGSAPANSSQKTR